MRGAQLFILVLGLGAWEMYVRTGIVDSFYFPSPTAIVIRLGHWATSRSIYYDAGVTLIEVLVSFVLGSAIGTAAGIWLGLSPLSAQILDPFIKAFMPFPASSSGRFSPCSSGSD